MPLQSTSEEYELGSNVRRLRVQDGRLLDAAGHDFVIRGINHGHAWYPLNTQALADISQAGANAVRLVLTAGRFGFSEESDVANVVDLCRRVGLVAVLECHDTSGYGDDPQPAMGNPCTLDEAADYWLAISNALRGREAHVIVNIGNEPIGNRCQSSWRKATIDAIVKLRSAGLEHTLMVDAPDWGQDASNTMRENAAAVFAADPLGNTVFSVHMYHVYDAADTIISYIDSFTSQQLPLVIGEFGWIAPPSGGVETGTIMAHAQARGVGWIAWSWSGNSGGNESLDMVVGFNATQLTPWGSLILHGADGLSTSLRATI